MYSPHSPTLSSGGHAHLDSSSTVRVSPNHSPRAYSSVAHSYSSGLGVPTAYAAHHQHQHHYQPPTNCLRFKYFTTFFVCTTCLALLAASLATHKWLVSKPIRVLRLSGQPQANFSALMLAATLANIDQNNQPTETSDRQAAPTRGKRARLMSIQQHSSQVANLFGSESQASSAAADASTSSAGQFQQPSSVSVGNKFQGEIYFGLFNGIKVLNYGFGDRVSQLSVLQTFFGTATKNSTAQQPFAHELVNFGFWLTTLTSVVSAVLFALIGSIFAIINFVMTPRGTFSGPVGLVIWNASACFACLIAIFAWLIEYYLRLKSNVLTHEEVLNGWTSENRSQFGYSYYLVVLAFVLHLINIFIVSLVQFETWTSQKAAKRHMQTSRHPSPCEGVIMLY